MKSKIKILILSAVWAAGFISCDNMDEKYKQYLEETNYSGKVSGLKASAGNERVLLEWTNPIDQKSKKIKVVFNDGISDAEKEFDTLVESAMMDGLALSSYTFTVYTIDDYGNESIPVSVSKSPYTAAHISSLTPPRCTIQKQNDGKYTVNMINVSSALMKFGGKIDYRINGSDGSVISDTFTKDATNALTDVAIANVPLSEGVEYTIQYEVTVYPALLKNKKPDGTLEYTEVSFDTTIVSGNATVTP